MHLGLILIGAFGVTGADELGYDKMVEIVKVVPTRVKGKAWEIETTFNLVPDMPKGVKINFTLKRDRDGMDVEAFHFTLADENRKGIKQKWTPKDRLSVGEYYFSTDIVLADQTKDTQKAIEKNEKRFPPKSAPWNYQHTYEGAKFQVGTKDDEKAEFEEVKTFLMARTDKLIELNGEMLDELDKAGEGTAYSKSGKLDIAAFKKYLNGWGKKVATEQKLVREADPGIYLAKYFAEQTEVLELGKMVAKRGFRGTEVIDLLKKSGLGIADLPVPTFESEKDEGRLTLDVNYSRKVSGKGLQDRYNQIQRKLGIKVEEEGEGEKAGAVEGGEKNAAGDAAEGSGEEEGASARKKKSEEEESSGEEAKKGDKEDESPKAQSSKASKTKETEKGKSSKGDTKKKTETKKKTDKKTKS
jgi:hypothetical protein